MRTETDAVRVLTLAVVLTLLGCAVHADIADLADFEDFSHNIDDGEGAVITHVAYGPRDIACTGDQAPRITINSHRGFPLPAKYIKSYGEKMILYCSAEDTSKIEMKVNGKTFQADVINTTTIQLEVNEPYLGQYIIICADYKTGCNNSVTVEIEPAMYVKATRVHHEPQVGAWHKYFVPLNETYEVFCSGNDAKSLRIENDDKEQLLSDVVNRTMLRYGTRADSGEELYLWCLGKGKTVNGVDVDVFEGIQITVDYYPECQHFRCFIHDWRIIECVWQYLTNTFTYTLLYIDLDNDNQKSSKVLCVDIPGNLSNMCKFDIKIYGRETFFWNENISLILQTCNDIFCYNETFNMETTSLIKLDTVSGFDISQTNSQVVDLEWNIASVEIPLTNNSGWDTYYCDTCVYRVEFRLAAFRDEWRQADTSSVRCIHVRCVFQLPLPYPDTEYEVRVYARHKNALELWSEPNPNYVDVRTEPKAPCACNSAFQLAESTVSTETASCESCMLTEDIIHEILWLKNKIKVSLKQKLENAKEIAEIFSKSKEMADRLKIL